MSVVHTRESTAQTPVRAALAALLVLSLLVTGAAAAGAQEAGQRIGDADDPVQASIAISQATRDDGSVDRVVLGRRDAFPDNLSGAGVVGQTGALLLVDPAPAGLSEPIAEELGRLLGEADPAGCGTGLDAEVILLGGEAALSPNLADDLTEAGFCVDRLSGPSRVETSVEVARAMLAAGTPRQTLLIARDDNPADSATAGGWAAANGVPLVVTSSTSLHPAVAALLDPSAGQWTDIVILGGPAAISPEVESAIAQAAGPGAQIRRIAGASRDDTARRIATDLWSTAAGSTVGIVNGFNDTFWTYALPGGAALGATSTPLLYVSTTQIPAPTAEYLAGRTGVITLGPPSLIPDTIKTQAEGLAAGTDGGPTPVGGLDGLRRIDIPAPGGDAVELIITVEPGESALAINAPDVEGGEVTFELVEGPGGLRVENPNLQPNSALVLPNSAVPELPSGTYTITVTSQNGFSDIVAFAKASDSFAPQAIDTIVYVVTNDPQVDTAAERAQMSELLSSRFDEMFGQHNLFSGTVTFEDVSDDVLAEFATTSSEAFTDLCDNLAASTGISRTLRVALIDTYTDGDLFGIAAGIPAGSIAPARNTCATIGMQAHYVEEDFDSSNFAQTFWHEAGHLLGLFHTTEEPGDSHDPIEDTPECDSANDSDSSGQVDAAECVGTGGENLMFWEGINRVVTPGQADVIRYSPLFRPRG